MCIRDRCHMNSRERVLAAINHREPDKVPMDLGGCGQTGINASSLYHLREAFGLPPHPLHILSLLHIFPTYFLNSV